MFNYARSIANAESLRWKNLYSSGEYENARNEQRQRLVTLLEFSHPAGGADEADGLFHAREVDTAVGGTARYTRRYFASSPNDIHRRFRYVIAFFSCKLMLTSR